MMGLLRLSSLIGPDRVIWRYDPILFCRGINLDFHLANFDNLAQKLSGFTHKCIFSFLDFYKKTVRKMSDLDLINPDISRRKALLSGISEIASFNKIELNACCEPDNYSELNIKKADAICTIPASLVTTKNIEIPSLDEEEIKSIIDIYKEEYEIN